MTSSEDDYVALRALLDGSSASVAIHRLLIQASSCAIVALTPDLRVVEWNPHAEKIFGMSRGHALGQDYIHEFVPAHARDGVRRDLDLVLSGQSARDIESVIVSREGVKHTLLWNVEPIVNDQDATVGLIAIGQDVTEWRISQTQLAHVLDAMIDPVIAIDATGAIVLANPAVATGFGWEPDQLLGRNVSVLMAEPYRSEHDAYLRTYRETGQAKAIGVARSVIGRRRDGTDFPCQISISEITEPGPARFVGVVRDTSETEELSLRLSQAERLAAVGELAAGVAHEINNPVTTIINCAQLIREGDTDARLPDDIVQEGMRIASIVRDLLDFSRQPADYRAPTDIRSVIERTFSLIGSRIRKQGIQLNLNEDPSLPTIPGRAQQLQQVLLNLLLNARDALVADPRKHDKLITVTTCKSDDGKAVVLIVRDNGPGVPDTVQERIFQPFFTTKRDRGGTGLGLAVSMGIVESHGGTLQCQSKAGEYAEFRVTLPWADESADDDEA